MARFEVGGYKTNSNVIPAVVLQQRDANGAVVATGRTGVVEVDVLLLGIDQGKRTAAVAGSEATAAVNQFFWAT